MIKRHFVTVALAALVVLLGSAPADAQLVWMDPPPDVVLGTIGAQTDVVVRVNGQNPLWGVELYMTFDPALVTIYAANTPGTCPAPDFVIYDDFDNVAGLVRYSVSAVTSGPCDSVGTPDQDVVTMHFERLAFGISAINFSLVNPPGISIITDGSVAVCDDSTPACWQNTATDVPVELMTATVN